MILRMARMVERFRRNVSGASAVEFAFIAPVLIAFYFGLAEYTQALIAQRRNASTASAIGDLVAQANGEITSGDIDDIMDMKNVLMNPFPVSGTQMKICVNSIYNDGTKNVVKWRRSENDSTCPAANATASGVPSEIITTGESVIMAKVSYTYTSAINYVVKKPIVFTKTYYLRPRRSSQITCSTCT